MPEYKAPLDDYRFLLNDVFDFDSLTSFEGFEEATADMVEAILNEGARVCEQELFPLNASGDEEGAHFHEDGRVTTPKGYKEAYQTYAQGGWNGLSAPVLYGGQGLPQTLNTIMAELISASNMAFGMYPGLTQGAINALLLHATDTLKETYLPKMISGEWSGTMNLTEPHCGTDLGLIRTKAVDNGDGSYALTGSKIYISCGEHDLTDNIIHLVLARIEGAPEGVKGISLFVVPKYFVNDDGSVGDRNPVACGSIEEKMGIHGSATCTMNFDGAKGWLVGEENRGLAAMFTMMNEARLHVGMQGLGLADVAYQNAVLYAKERLQSRSLSGAKYPDKPADPIIVHGDVRRMLLIQKAFIEGARALAVETSMKIDIAHKHEDEKARQDADDYVGLMIPIIKAYFTDMACESTYQAMQVLGGAGYCREYGLEQYARDARITPIYEGTNGIQALDLVGRKMTQNMGRALRQFFLPAQNFIKENKEHASLGALVNQFEESFGLLQKGSMALAQKAMKDREEAGAAATDLLRLFALNVMAYQWLRMAKVAYEKLEKGEGDKTFLEGKIHTARFFITRMLPESHVRFAGMMSGADVLLSFKEEQF